MSSILSRGAIAALPTLLLLGACGTDLDAPAAEEERQLDLDVAQFAADATGDDIVLMTDEADETMRPGFADQSGCTRQGFRRIRCGPRDFGGDLSFTREVTFLDEFGDEQDAFDPQTTASINMVVSMEGDRTRGPMSVSVNRQRNVTVSGLLGDETERTSNGTGSASVNRTHHSDENGDRVYDMSASTTITNVVIAVPRQGTWPLSGTIAREITVEVVRGLEDTRTRTRSVTVEFNGTQFVSITIDGETFTLDLATREIVDGG